MWTAPLCKICQGADRIACDHMFGLLSRSRRTAAKMGSAAWVPNITAVFNTDGFHGVSLAFGSIDPHHLSSLASAGLSAGDCSRRIRDPSWLQKSLRARRRRKRGARSGAPIAQRAPLTGSSRCVTSAVVALAADHQLPNNPSCLVRQSDCSHFSRLALDELHQPPRVLASSLRCLLNHSSSADDQ
jgi:hypothetical protein